MIQNKWKFRVWWPIKVLHQLIYFDWDLIKFRKLINSAVRWRRRFKIDGSLRDKHSMTIGKKGISTFCSFGWGKNKIDVLNKQELEFKRSFGIRFFFTFDWIRYRQAPRRNHFLFFKCQYYFKPRALLLIDSLQFLHNKSHPSCVGPHWQFPPIIHPSRPLVNDRSKGTR